MGAGNCNVQNHARLAAAITAAATGAAALVVVLSPSPANPPNSNHGRSPLACCHPALLPIAGRARTGQLEDLAREDHVGVGYVVEAHEGGDRGAKLLRDGPQRVARLDRVCATSSATGGA